MSPQRIMGLQRIAAEQRPVQQIFHDAEQNQRPG
jgi:hypothetical protein